MKIYLMGDLTTSKCLENYNFIFLLAIQMERLLELLSEFWEYDLVEHNWEICKWDTDDETGEINIYTDYTNNIISKKFWFIKWLVDNQKIDINRTPWHYIYHYTDEDVVKEALMQLAIQDNPIKFLISLLKE